MPASRLHDLTAGEYVEAIAALTVARSITAFPLDFTIFALVGRPSASTITSAPAETPAWYAGLGIFGAAAFNGFTPA
jgi:hypothetical protein